MTDLWRGYRRLRRRFGFNHLTVNHSENFVHLEPALLRPENARRFIRRPRRLQRIQIHTQTVESFWSNIKRKMKRRGGIRLPNLQNHLNELNWLYQNQNDLVESSKELISIYDERDF